MARDPYKAAAFSLSNRFLRAIWAIAYILTFRPSPKVFFAWRRFILRIFGAKIGNNTCINPSAKIWAPWNLDCEDMVAIGYGVEIYNPSRVTIRSHAIISQGSYLCGASHDHNSADFPLYSKSITVGRYAWICARACVLPGVSVGDGAVLALASVATRDLEAWGVYVGSPARYVKSRCRQTRLE